MSDYLPPFNDPQECDHDQRSGCSRCCPCDDCGAIRADDVADGTYEPDA